MVEPVQQLQRTAQSVTAPLQVLIRDREGVLFEGEAEAVSSFNDKGPFDILSYHTNFISLIRDSVIVRKSAGVEEKLYLEQGVLKVKENRVEIYVGIIH